MEPQLVKTLFANVEEYLHFVRHLRQFSRSSTDGGCKASLSKEDGWYYWYRLRVEDGPTICQHVHRFRATPEMLAQFHAGCSEVADHMERYLETWDDSWLEAGDAFGNLSGDTGDSSDYDNWIDLVEDPDLLQRLHRVEGHHQDGDDFAAWDELQLIPASHEYHVEVLRRRLLFYHYAGFVDHGALTRWARALVEAEPYDAINWTSLEYAEEPSEADYFAALSSNIADTQGKIRYVRMRLWWTGNDHIRRDGSQQLSGEHLMNLDAFTNLLSDSDPNQRLMKAEAMRELSRFDEALSLLVFEFPDEYLEAVERVRELANSKYAQVAKLS